LGIAYMAASTPKEWDIDFRDDRIEDVGFDDELDLVAISCFTPSGKRAMEIADEFRARGTKVVMGGIFPTTVPHEAGQHADALVLGEGEGVWPKVLEDVRTGNLAPTYKAEGPFDPCNLPLPRVDLYIDKEGGNYRPDDYPVQISRGCTYSCSACAVPLTLGRTFRHMEMDHAMGQVDQLNALGKLASFTEDTSFFPGSGLRRRFGDLLDALHERGGEASVSYVGISMPMILITPPAFFERLRRAGVKMFYLVGGFDPITQGAFTGKDKKNYDRAVEAIKRCHDHDVEPYTSFLVGNDGDDEGSFDRMLEFCEEVKLKKAEFAVRTPYPGTPTFVDFEKNDRLLHKDWSRYNDAHAVFKPAQMSPERLQEGYLYLWREFYRSRTQLKDLDDRERTIQF